ncbi:hypothetical protein MSG28_008388 [Choristoneura fumiferana]|uniref:Uncharacterized protein n=1 Tax=Choristoneura fumiferana TaxID=7141 RepID=A0ACC0J508_CHOFU|nr:hypothetical protein MSG28_008388 [Choristoneura fumiferana]
MAEAPESDPVPSSSENPLAAAPDPKEDEGPQPEKRRKLDKETSEKLEHRLGGILCCAVCLDLPPAAVYQCSNGHLMCAPCFTHLLADARLRDEAATCPNCRVEISKTSASRNLAVEKTVSELPSECKYCAKVFPRHSLQHHEEKNCEDREYKFSQVVVSGRRRGWPGWGAVLVALGLQWLASAARGAPPRSAPAPAPAAAHEAACAHPAKSAAEVVDHLAERERQHQHNVATSRFSAFGHQWVVKAFVNRHQRDPTQSTQREITYQWVGLRGPYGEAAVRARVAAHSFADDDAEAPAQPLPLADHNDTNRLLGNKAIHFRLIMFLTSK